MRAGIIIYMYCFLAIVLYGQEKMLNYGVVNIGEIQYNISNKLEKDINYANLLAIGVSLKTDKWWKNGSFDIAFWSVGRTLNYSIADDFLTFSNIEEDNYWLVCSKFGYQHTLGDFSIFAGIRNVNIDYFISPYSSFFTNSSAGIYPTISMNYGMPNYPIGAFGIHAEYKKRKISIKNSYYNNLDNINKKLIFKFHFNPKKYGSLNISEFAYIPTGGFYAGGVLLDKQPETALGYSLYMLAEQRIAKVGRKEIGAIGQLGYALKKNNHCYAYYGAGLIVNNLFSSNNKDTFGLIFFRANTTEDSETATEFSYKFAINQYLSIQPAFHYIHSSSTDDLIGLVRGIFTFGN